MYVFYSLTTDGLHWRERESERAGERADRQRGGPVISGFTELLNASWEEGELLRGRVLRKALVITFSFEPFCVQFNFTHVSSRPPTSKKKNPSAGCCHRCYQIKCVIERARRHCAWSIVGLLVCNHCESVLCWFSGGKRSGVVAT